MQPGHPLERIYTVIIMICSIFISSVVVGEVLLIMNRKSELNMAFDEQMQQSREFMTVRKVPVDLQVRIYRYLESLHKLRRGGAGDNRAFMTDLSAWLQVELIESVNREHVCRHPFFKQIADDRITRRICLEAVPLVFAAGDLVVQKGHPATNMHFLVRGKLRVDITTGSGMYLKPPSWIGEKCLFLETNRTHTVSAVTPSEILTVEKASIQVLCEEYAEMQELYNSFLEQIEGDDFEMLLCCHCGEMGHDADNCPLIVLPRSAAQKSRCRSRRAQRVLPPSRGRRREAAQVTSPS